MTTNNRKFNLSYLNKYNQYNNRSIQEYLSVLY